MYSSCAFLITDTLKYVIVHIVHCISVRRYWIAVNEMLITALVRKFILMDMSEVILNSVAIKKKSNPLCSTRDENYKNHL
jgi:hypothetical protein